MVVWALFDSGNGCYTQVAKERGIEIYPIGIDVKGREGDFINLNLADYGRLFKDDKLFVELDTLPKPDVILASPPCESWSVASAMFGGNASWKKGLCENVDKQTRVVVEGQTRFIVRPRTDYTLDKVQFQFHRSFMQRINGELTAYNTICIIARYKPKVFVIENPKLSRIWSYIEDILGVNIPFANATYYANYGYPISKPTCFKSNIDLRLDSTKRKAEKTWDEFSRDYNTRSNIPLPLIHHIFDVVQEYIDG